MDIFDHLNSALTQARVLQAKLDAANVSALHDALSETIKQRDEARMQNNHLRTEVDRAGQLIYALKAQVQNLQEFNDKQRQQLETLQKEMAAIHMCVVAASRSKLYDAMESYHGVYGELPFLLKAVATAAEKAFDSKDAAEKYASRIRAARHELEA